MDNALRRSLVSRHGVEVSFRTELRYPLGGGFYEVVTGVRAEGLTPENHADACALVEAMAAEPSHEQAELLAIKLEAGTKRRAEDEASMAFAADLYIHELRQWPLDVAQAAVEALLDDKWFPAVAELRAACRKLGDKRRATRRALTGWSPSPADLKAAELREQARALRIEAAELGKKAGPGPVDDEGPRGELLAERARMEREAEARQAEAEQILRAVA